MPAGWERNLKSNEDRPDAVASQDLNPEMEPTQLVPTPETQELYNSWREAQERESLTAILGGISNGTGYLLPPSPPQGTVSSPPLLNTTRPLLNTTRPLLNTTRPLLNTTRPLLNTTRPLLNTTRPLINTWLLLNTRLLLNPWLLLNPRLPLNTTRPLLNTRLLNIIKLLFSTSRAPLDTKLLLSTTRAPLDTKLLLNTIKVLLSTIRLFPNTTRRWYWGYYDASSASVSGQASRVPNQDRLFSGLSSETNLSSPFSGFAGGYNNQNGQPYASGYANPNGGGGGQFYQTARSISSRTSSQGLSKSAPAKARPATCKPLGHDLSWLFPSSSAYYSKGVISKTALLQYVGTVCPAAVVLLFFIIASVDGWIQGSPDQHCGGLRNVASCIVGGHGIRVASASELAVGSVVAGVMAAWLFQHVKVRLKDRLKKSDRRYGRSIRSLSPVVEDARVVIAAA
ncbi:hypothetical protein N0V88_003440 [Collariella sp. IMI 366227]|nr:hypothetical protein N0V88_003440 [Collariella sp. IMI 366227]